MNCFSNNRILLRAKAYPGGNEHRYRILANTSVLVLSSKIVASCYYCLNILDRQKVESDAFKYFLTP